MAGQRPIPTVVREKKTSPISTSKGGRNISLAIALMSVQTMAAAVSHSGVWLGLSGWTRSVVLLLPTSEVRILRG